MKIIKTIEAWRMKRLGNKLRKLKKEIEKVTKWKRKGLASREELEWLEGYYLVDIHKVEAKLENLRRKCEKPTK